MFKKLLKSNAPSDRTIPIEYLTEKIEYKLSAIEKSSKGDLNDTQLGMINGLQYVLDAIIDYDTPKESVKPEPSLETVKSAEPLNENRKKRFTYKKRGSL